MAGTYRRLKNSTWELCSCTKGKRYYRYLDKKTGVREVEKRLAAFVAECEDNNYIDYEKLTMGKYIDYWLQNYAVKELKNHTLERYKQMIPRIKFCLGHKKLHDLKPVHLLQFYDQLGNDGVRLDGKEGGLSNRTINHHHRLISAMLQKAVEWQLLKENICFRVKPPKVQKKEMDIYSIQDCKKLIQCLENEDIKYKLIVLIAIFTGFRRGEIMGIEWSHIDLENNLIKVVQTSTYTKDTGIVDDTLKTERSKRAIYIPGYLAGIIKLYKIFWNNRKNKIMRQGKWNETDKLFVQWNGNPMHPDTISSYFPKFIKKYDLKYTTFHGLRHFFCSVLANVCKMDVHTVADAMGHSNIDMLVSNYSHNILRSYREVAENLENVLLKNDNKDNFRNMME